MWVPAVQQIAWPIPNCDLLLRTDISSGAVFAAVQVFLTQPTESVRFHTLLNCDDDDDDDDDDDYDDDDNDDIINNNNNNNNNNIEAA